MQKKHQKKRPFSPWRRGESERNYTKRAIEAANSAWRPCLKKFAAWLEDDRQLELSSITVRIASARTFVQTLPQHSAGGVATLRKIGVKDVEDVFVKYNEDHGPAARRSMQAAMRLFLSFAATHRWVAKELADSVPSLKTYRLSHTPQGIDDESIRRFLALRERMLARDWAIALILVVYGVRRGQVTNLQLGDIGWRERTITFPAHKGGKPVHHTLIPSVAEALAGYVRQERPQSDSRILFLRNYPPHLPLSPSAVSATVFYWLRKAEVDCSPAGPHVFRHAFATRLLASGQTLKTIADLLGHRSLESVSNYAKVDHPRLKEVAAEWPEVKS